jgi:hypothetical protein
MELIIEEKNESNFESIININNEINENINTNNLKTNENNKGTNKGTDECMELKNIKYKHSSLFCTPLVMQNQNIFKAFGTWCQRYKTGSYPRCPTLG